LNGRDRLAYATLPAPTATPWSPGSPVTTIADQLSAARHRPVPPRLGDPIAVVDPGRTIAADVWRRLPGSGAA
jgi:hypothetical protein